MDTPTQVFMWSVQALAQPAKVQVSLLPDFVDVTDELALQFDDALMVFLAGPGQQIPGRARTAIERIDHFLDQMSHERDQKFWGGPAALASDPRWEKVRKMAAEVLNLLGWENQRPPRDGAVYISSARVHHNVEEDPD